MDQAPLHDDPDAAAVAAAGARDAGVSLSERVRASMLESLGLTSPNSDWTAPVAIAIVEGVLDERQARLPLTEPSSVEVLRRGLYQMSYEAALACEHARHPGVPGGTPQTAAQPGHASAAQGGRELKAEQRLRAALDADDGQAHVSEPRTVGELAQLLCLCVIDAHGARDRYDYWAMEAALDACDHWMPAGYTVRSFRALEVLRTVAKSGLSRAGDIAPPTQKELERLAELIHADRGDDESPYPDYAQLSLIVAIGHMQRSSLVEDIRLSASTGQHSLADWALAVLGELEAKGVADSANWPVQGHENPVAHHIHFYRHFAHHVRAMALADQMKDAAQSWSADADDTRIDADVSTVRDEYGLASASLERALSLVPAHNAARWRYYDLNAENLEHEESLRLELLEQRLQTRRTVRALADDHVKRFAEASKEEIRESMTSVSMRVVEIIGVFLAVVTVLGSTIASATLGDISFAQRIVILAVGGTMPVIYFVLLRWIVSGTLGKRRNRSQNAAAAP